MSTKIVPIEPKPLISWTRQDIKMCEHPEHNPPPSIVIPPGHKMIHTCPECGTTREIGGPELNCDGTDIYSVMEN
jgi:hypothetical protein